MLSAFNSWIPDFAHQLSVLKAIAVDLELCRGGALETSVSQFWADILLYPTVGSGRTPALSVSAGVSYPYEGTFVNRPELNSVRQRFVVEALHWHYFPPAVESA